MVNVPYEVINQWEDWVRVPTRTTVNDVNVFSTAELQAIEDFRPVWEAAATAIGDDYPPLREVQALSTWSRLRRQADAASRVFDLCGKLPEDREFERE